MVLEKLEFDFHYRYLSLAQYAFDWLIGQIKCIWLVNVVIAVVEVKCEPLDILTWFILLNYIIYAHYHPIHSHMQLKHLVTFVPFYACIIRTVVTRHVSYPTQFTHIYNLNAWLPLFHSMLTYTKIWIGHFITTLLTCLSFQFQQYYQY
jgi:hypothetical protein